MNEFRACVAASAAGAVLVGASVVAVAPRTVPDVASFNVQLTAGEQDIMIDFVRHAQTFPSGATVAVASNGLPGFPLSTTGEQQAVDVGNQLFGQFGGPNGVAGIFGGQEQRMVETAAPFAALEHMIMQLSPLGSSNEGGFNEIGGGIYEHDAPGSVGSDLYLLTEAAWAFGLRFVPLPGSNDFNGMQFEESFSNAVNSMYTDTVTNVTDPVVSANGHITDVVFSGGSAISAWTLMNVNNPDLPTLLPIFLSSLSGGGQSFLPNVSQVVIEGNPTDGWTLVSFNGTAMPADPDLLTALFVDVRDLIVAPQQAWWDISQAILNGDPTEISTAFQDGLQSVGTALTQFPEAVINDIISALGTSG